MYKRQLKGFAWLATQPNYQMTAALAGTEFTMTHGAPWMAAHLDAIPRAQWIAEVAQWPADSRNKMNADLYGSDDTSSFRTWDAEHGDRRTELVCIGRALDYDAAVATLEACLLTPEEMAGDKRRWLALTDPYADPHEQQQVERDLRLSDGVLVALLAMFMAMVYACLP